jgi:hypothetical protein
MRNLRLAKGPSHLTLARLLSYAPLVWQFFKPTVTRLARSACCRMNGKSRIRIGRQWSASCEARCPPPASHSLSAWVAARLLMTQLPASRCAKRQLRLRLKSQATAPFLSYCPIQGGMVGLGCRSAQVMSLPFDFFGPFRHNSALPGCMTRRGCVH